MQAVPTRHPTGHEATPEPTPPARPSIENCSIVGTMDALGDTWSILVLRELFFGVHRFNDIQRDLDISRSVLAERLNRLVALGVAKVVPYQDPGTRVRNEYRLTRKGVELLPVMVALMEWGDRHVRGGVPSVTLLERGTGAQVHVELRAGDHEVAPNQIVPVVTPA